MPQFFASTSIGLADVLEKELIDLGLKIKLKMKGGIIFESNWEGCYKANLHSRFASRILKPVLEFTAYDLDELYNNIRKHDFTKYIEPHQTMTVDAKVEDSAIRDQRMLAMKVKDAVVDQFREAFNERPSVNNDNAALRVHIKGYNDQYYVSVDTSGESLFKRGYRLQAGEAPMKENLGAGLVALSEWDRKSPIVDPMCGSGTILIEAALMATDIAPGLLRTRFAFQEFKGFDQEVWARVVDEAADKAKEDLDFKFYGFDHDKEVLMKAKANAKKAGVDHLIEFKREVITLLKRPVEKGLIVTNPPYGARIGEEDNLKDVYRDFSHTLKTEFKGWSAWMLAGNKDLIRELKLKSTRKHFIFNGSIECRFLRYDMF